MRDESSDEATVASRHNELRDIHHRIDSLKEESERQYSHVIDRLHSMELAIAQGGRFPPAAWVAAAGIFLTVIGTGAVTFAKLESAALTSNKALSLIEAHMQGSSARFQSIQDAASFVEHWGQRLPALDERLKTLESKVVGQGPEGWHRRDHDLYAQLVEERFSRIKGRLDVIEARQEHICDRVRECRVNK